MKIVYIHGSRASARSFNYIRSQMPGHDEILLGYNSEHGFFTNHARMLKSLHGESNILFVAHGLGGIHALHLAHELRGRVLSGVTISTPYGGCPIAELSAGQPDFSQSDWDLRPRSEAIQACRELLLPSVAWTNLVSIAGSSPLLAAANDGVFTVESMRRFGSMHHLNVACGHFEILQHEETVATIRHEIEMLELALQLTPA